MKFVDLVYINPVLQMGWIGQPLQTIKLKEPNCRGLLVRPV